MTDMPMPPGGIQDRPDTASGGPGPRHDEEVARLSDLHTRLVDTLDGYDKVVEKAEPEFLATAEDFRSLHQAQAERVVAMLVGLGHDPGSEGSVFGTVNRAVVEVRSWFADIGHNIMDGIADGEKRVLADMDAAVSAAQSVERRAALEGMRSETLELLRRHAPDKL